MNNFVKKIMSHIRKIHENYFILILIMKNIEKAKIYRKRYERLIKISNPSPRLIALINKVQTRGLYFCLLELYNKKTSN